MNIDKQIKEKLKLLTLLTFHEDCEVCNSYLLEVVSQIKKTIYKEIMKKVEKMKFSERDLSMTENLNTNVHNEALNKVISVIKDLLVTK